MVLKSDCIATLSLPQLKMLYIINSNIRLVVDSEKGDLSSLEEIYSDGDSTISFTESIAL